jgi:formylglycine-generating enzyme required for sulfatase activity
MLGDVWQWTADWYDAAYYKRGENLDPKGPPKTKERALRGGAFNLDAAGVRVSNRTQFEPASRESYIGFRCAGD